MSTTIPDFSEAAQAAAADELVRRCGESIAIELADTEFLLDQAFGFAPGEPPGSAT